MFILSSKKLLLFSFSCLLLFKPLRARSYKVAWKRSSTSVKETETYLFSHIHDPLGDEDKWSSLTDDHRRAWTAANQILPLKRGITDLLNITKSIKNTPINVPVEIHIVACPTCLTKEDNNILIQYSKALKGGWKGAILDLRLRIAPETLYNRISMQPPARKPTDFLAIFQQAALSTGSANVLYLILNNRQKPVVQYKSTVPYVGTGRVSWVVYAIEKGNDLNLANMLVTAERAAQRIYSPSPLFFPIPFIRHLHVELAAYTPHHDHRALWLQNFAWDKFETAVRSVAIKGHTVSFFSRQANHECPRCETAFRHPDQSDPDFPTQASIVLNNNVVPNGTWAEDQTSTTYLSGSLPQRTMRIYVLDTIRLPKNGPLQHLESKPVSIFPGMGIIIIRSSNHDSVRSLEFFLIKAVVAAAYGTMEPDLYITQQLSRVATSLERRTSAVLHDVINRHLVRSVVETRIEELEEIAEGLLYFKIDPSKTLGAREYTLMVQRVNLIIFKLKRAQDVLETNDADTALYLASSTRHDMKAIRNSFGLTESAKSLERFRDPTIRCDFSNIRREALKASQIFESRYPSFRSSLLVATSFTTGAILTHFLISQTSTRKSRGKRE